MAEDRLYVGGDGGPLIVLQTTAVPQWQGANDFDNSLMNGGQVETDYDFICGGRDTEEIGVVSRYSRDMLILWDSEWGACLLVPEWLSLSPNALVFTRCYDPDDLPSLLPSITECLHLGQPQHSFHFHVQDTTLRLQVGADSPDPSYTYNYLDIPVVPGKKRCDVFFVEYDWIVIMDAYIVVNGQE